MTSEETIKLLQEEITMLKWKLNCAENDIKFMQHTNKFAMHENLQLHKYIISGEKYEPFTEQMPKWEIGGEL